MNKIIMYYRPGCHWCEKWKREVKPLLEKAKWRIEEVLDNKNPVPNFEIHNKGKVVKHTGFMSIEKFQQLL